MRMNPLGRSSLTVSELCLGTMTFGTQTLEPEGHAQIDLALERGINFFDTAEMYPVNPVKVETIGRTEQIIGNWIQKNTARRDSVILATKHSGEGLDSVRGGALISSLTIPEAIEGSLRRLKTDYIDLYQFHWPNRGSFMFRKNWKFDPSSQNKVETLAHIEDALETLQKQLEKGNIRHFGLSNDSAWGTSQWLRISEDHGWPRVISMQNEYSLMCRLYDTDMAELSFNEDVGLIAFSPLAAGLLTGKYQNGVIPKGSRLSLSLDLGGRMSDNSMVAVDAYLAVARKYQIDPVHMALAWCRTRVFMASAIFGATTLAQLEHALDAVDVDISAELIAELDAVHKEHPMPY
jgi:aryl-alcohol dehydrogenase-like predicted oxidoreductase